MPDDATLSLDAERHAPKSWVGARIGRYTVLDKVGEGGMGTVYVAFDAELDRKVAIKVLRSGRVLEGDSSAARARLLREAQAMARLSHPNVVAVHDVGTFESQVYLAMEFVDGVTLREWLKTPRPWREKLTLLKAAGRGLAAAHAAGLVHRDFKADNVLIGKDGRVRVSDFGVARLEANAPLAPASPENAAKASTGNPDDEATVVPSAPETSESSSDSGSSKPSGASSASGSASAPLTLEGSLLGTVGYMAPEQVLGLVVDARADQFAFCVTVYAALYGTKPFPGKGLSEYVFAIQRPVPAPPRGARIPAWVRRVLLKGLAFDPERRYASMDALLDALDADPRSRTLALAAFGAVFAAASLVGLVRARHEAAERTACAAEGDSITSAWGPPARDAVVRAMRADNDPLSSNAVDATVAALDEYARDWSREESASCSATRLAKTQTAEVHEKRSLCLLEARMQLEGLAWLLGSDNQSAHRQALALAHGLPAARLCTAEAAARTFYPLPKDPTARDKALAARREMAQASVLRTSGRIAEGKEVAERAMAGAHEAGDPLGEAKAELEIGRLLRQRHDNDAAVERMFDALTNAEALGADHLTATCAGEAAFLLGARLKREKEAGVWLRLARAKLSKLGADEPVELLILTAEYAMGLDRPRQALEQCTRALELTKRTLGELHPETCTQLQNRGTIYRLLGEGEPAEASYRQAIECELRASGPGAATLGFKYRNLASTQLSLGIWDEARANAQRAAEIQAGLDPGGKLYLQSILVQVVALDGLRRYADAEREVRRVLDVAKDPDTVSYAHYALGLARLGQGDAKGAKEECVHAEELRGKGVEYPTPYDGDTLRCIGEAELALGEAKAAVEHLEKSTQCPLRSEPGELGVTRFALARALLAAAKPADANTAKTNAMALATQARDELRGVVEKHPYQKPQLEAVEHWIAQQAP